MKNCKPLLGHNVELIVSGYQELIRGRAVDFGQDILVLYTGKQFMYIPLIHMKQMRVSEQGND
ncbi:DUF2642 domain-containing protein, partial [Paenibacillus sp. MCAF20]